MSKWSSTLGWRAYRLVLLSLAVMIATQGLCSRMPLQDSLKSDADTKDRPCLFLSGRPWDFDHEVRYCGHFLRCPSIRPRISRWCSKNGTAVALEAARLMAPGNREASVRIFLSKDLAKEMEKGISDSSEHRPDLQPKALQLLLVPGGSAEPAGCASGRVQTLIISSSTLGMIPTWTV